MDSSILIRATQEDKVNLKLAAQSAGKDVSAFIRDILIREKVITPLWTNQANDTSCLQDKKGNASQRASQSP